MKQKYFLSNKSDKSVENKAVANLFSQSPVTGPMPGEGQSCLSCVLGHIELWKICLGGNLRRLKSAGISLVACPKGEE